MRGFSRNNVVKCRDLTALDDLLTGRSFVNDDFQGEIRVSAKCYMKFRRRFTDAFFGHHVNVSIETDALPACKELLGKMFDELEHIASCDTGVHSLDSLSRVIKDLKKVSDRSTFAAFFSRDRKHMLRLTILKAACGKGRLNPCALETSIEAVPRDLLSPLSNDVVTIPMTFAEVKIKLKGLRGRTSILGHLKDMPVYNGGPTHRRWGKNIVFYPEDFKRLLESFSCPSKSSSVRADDFPPPKAKVTRSSRVGSAKIFNELWEVFASPSRL